jgi:hypothetical protein
MGDDIPFVPNKRSGGVVLGGKIAPIFFNTVEDSGALPIECPVDELAMGDVIVLKPHEGKIENEAGEVISEFSLKTDVILDEVKAGGRIPLIIGRSLTGTGPRGPRPRPPTCSAPRSTRTTPARALRWRRRWSARPAASTARASARAPTASRA